MRSYKEIAKETGTTIADVREAMSLAEKREMPVDHYYDDYDSRISLTFSPADYGRCEVAVAGALARKPSSTPLTMDSAHEK